MSQLSIMLELFFILLIMVIINCLISYIEVIWSTFEINLNNFEINCILSWSESCFMKSCTTVKLVITFGITVAKLFVLLLTNNNAKLLQRVKSGFNAEPTGINTNQKQHYRQYLDCLTDPYFKH